MNKNSGVCVCGSSVRCLVFWVWGPKRTTFQVLVSLSHTAVEAACVLMQVNLFTQNSNRFK